MTATFSLTHDYAAPAKALWADLVSLDALAETMDGQVAYEGLPGGEARTGDTHIVRIRRWGWLPLGKWTLHVAERDDAARLLRREEHGGPVKSYRHTLRVAEIGRGLSRQTETLEIDAGMLTGLVAPSFPEMCAMRHVARTKRLRPDGLVMRAARRGDLEEASALCIRSKASWGYDDQMLARMTGELSLTLKNLDTDDTQLAFKDGAMIGVAQVAEESGETHLMKLFISQHAFRTGLGRALYAWALNAARARGVSEMVIHSDPGAAAFYEAMGALPAGEAPSGSIPGRNLPRFTHSLEVTGP